MIEELHTFFDKIADLLEMFKIGLICEIAINIVVLYAISKALDIFEKSISERLIAGDKNNQSGKIVQVLVKILKCIVFFIMVASFLQTHGYSVSSLIAGFGITGLAVGFAANTTLSNVFGTVSIIADKSYKIGDYIKIGNYEGTVEAINMRSTKIRTLDNFITIIPNSMIANTEIINVSACHRRRIYETFTLTYDTSNEKLEQAIKIIENILANSENISKDYVVFLDELDSSSINIKVHAYIKTKVWAKFVKEKENFILEVVKQFRAEEIDFAFPTQTVYLAGENNEN